MRNIPKKKWKEKKKKIDVEQVKQLIEFTTGAVTASAALVFEKQFYGSASLVGHLVGASDSVQSGTSTSALPDWSQLVCRETVAH